MWTNSHPCSTEGLPTIRVLRKNATIAPLTVVSDLTVPVQRTENAQPGQGDRVPKGYLHTQNAGQGYARMAAVDAADHTNGKMARSLFDSAWVASQVLVVPVLPKQTSMPSSPSARLFVSLTVERAGVQLACRSGA